MPSKRSYEDIKNVIESEPDYELISQEYINNRTPLEILYKPGNVKFKIDFDHWSRGQRLPKNYLKIAMSDMDSFKESADFISRQEQFKEKLKIASKGELELVGEYINTKHNVTVKHLVCGSIITAQPRYLLAGNLGCRECQRKKFRKYDKLSEMQADIDRIMGDDKYTIIDDLNSEFINNKTDVNIRHEKCGKTFRTSAHRFITGDNRCPHCACKNTSNVEKEVLDYIKAIYTDEIVENYRENSRSKELDIYLPKLKIGIEYDGLYWHSEKVKDKNYHIDKTLYFADKGIRVIQIFEDEWLNKKDIVKSKLSHILKCDTNVTKLRASKCDVKIIDFTTKNEFLNKYHIQGADVSKINLGLFFKDILVAVMTFSKPRISLGFKDAYSGEYELSRYATNNEYFVYGAFDKLLKYFIENYNPDTIKTYADLRWTAYPTLGKSIYENTGFSLSHISQPDYFYISGKTRADWGKRYHRYTFRRSVLNKVFNKDYPKEKTELEIMHENGYSRIYDCGNAVYILKKK